MSLLNTGRSELEQANYASKTSTDMANKRQAQKSSLEYQNDVANNNRNGVLAGSAVNLGIAYAGYKHDQQVSEAKGLAGQSGGMNNSATGNSIANNDAFRSGTSGDSINTSGAGGNGGIVGSDAGGQTFNQQVSGTSGSQGLAGSSANGSVVGSNAGGTAYDNETGGGGGGYNTANPGSNVGSSTGSAATTETTQSLNTDVTNSSSAGSSSGENSGGSSGGAGGAAGAAFLIGGLYQLFSSF